MAEETHNASADPIVRRYQLLLEVAESISLHSDLPALFHDLAARLHRIANFQSLWLVLHDPARNTMLLHILETGARTDIDVVERTIHDSPSGLVWQTQESLIVPNIEEETRFVDAITLLKNHNIQSFCLLPLTTAHARLGAIGFGSTSRNAYKQADVEFLQQAAAQVAVAVDNTLRYQDARTSHDQLQHERDLLRSLLDLNNRIVSNLDLAELFKTISINLRRVMHCDGVIIYLLDPKINQLRVYALDFPSSKGLIQEETLISMEGLHGTVYRTGKSWMGNIQEIAESQPRAKLTAAEGIKFVCIMPLITRNRVLGVLSLGRKGEPAFSRDDSDFITQIASQVAIAVDNALEHRQVTESKERLEKQRLYLQEEIRTEHNFEEIIGQSDILKRALGQVETVAPTDSTVLILGETGTGKELVARAIHNLSSRRDQTFVKVNCAAIPLGLLESELFGHEKGAFTGAITQRIGRFELAHRGTLFLDEVGDIPPELQPKLLRVLQEQEFERLGSTKTLRVDVRVVAATSRDLQQMVAENKFRSDLYYRLNVFPIPIPALRERPEDIPLLVRHFVDKYTRRMSKQIQTIPAEAMDALTRYSWPGNVRELQNVIERAVIVSQGHELKVPLDDLKQEAAASPTPGITLEAAERDHILRVLRETNWVVGGSSGAAARLGMKRTTLQYRMKRLGIPGPK
jgi:formate hydrogenlyase transcriptional activator